MASKRGFTLVELLVVIAIISVLAALLLPSLEASLEQGRALTCMNNLRQHQLAITSYATDNRGALPRSNLFMNHEKYRGTIPFVWLYNLANDCPDDFGIIPTYIDPIAAKSLQCPTFVTWPGTMPSQNDNLLYPKWVNWLGGVGKWQCFNSYFYLANLATTASSSGWVQHTGPSPSTLSDDGALPLMSDLCFYNNSQKYWAATHTGGEVSQYGIHDLAYLDSISSGFSVVYLDGHAIRKRAEEMKTTFYVPSYRYYFYW